MQIIADSRCFKKTPKLNDSLIQRRSCPISPKGTTLGVYSRVTLRILQFSAKLSRLWLEVAATKTRSRRVYPFGIVSPPGISKFRSAGLTSSAKRTSKNLAIFFLLQRCLGKSRAVRPSVSKANETTGMYNGPLNKLPR